MPRLTLKILGRDYLFNVSEEDTATLQNAANIINSRAARLHAADTDDGGTSCGDRGA